MQKYCLIAQPQIVFTYHLMECHYDDQQKTNYEPNYYLQSSVTQQPTDEI